MNENGSLKHNSQQEREGRPKVLRDPIHDVIYLGRDDEFILDLIDTKEFQRLRRIRQLGLAHLVYPGAEHTRFAHSLGVFNFARRMIERLQAKCAKQDAEELDAHARDIKAAALLHDIGHGPFSHVFERVFQDQEKKPANHEEWTCRIILDESTEVHQKLTELKIDANRVASLIRGNVSGESECFTPPLQPYCADIVSGQLDADRMDYLLRDSLFTGSRYGQYDSEWILNALAIGEVQWETGTLKKLCLDASKGTGAIEGLLFARLLMTKYVYGHKTTRAYENEMISTVRLAQLLVNDLPKDTPQPIRTALEDPEGLDTKQYLMLDDEVLWWALRRWAIWKHSLTGNQGEFANALKRHSLRLVRRCQPWRTRELTGPAYMRARRLVASLESSPMRFECSVDNVEALPYKDLPYQMATEADDEQAFFSEIHLIRKDGTVGQLSQLADTPVLQALTKDQSMFRFHYDPAFDEVFTGLLAKYGVC